MPRHVFSEAEREIVLDAIKTREWVAIPAGHPGDTIRLLVTLLLNEGAIEFSFRSTYPGIVEVKVDRQRV